MSSNLLSQTLIQRPNTFFEPLPLQEWFPRRRLLEVELGTGDGSFLAHYAALHPDHDFLGVERLLGRLRKLDRKGLRTGLSNLKLIRVEAGYLVEYLLPPKTVDAFHLYFPDPWPKRRHHKHRLVNERFPLLVATALRPEGVIYLRTDHADYFEQMRRVFAAFAGFRAVNTPVELRELPTDFERDFHAQGIHTLHAAYQKV